MTSRPRFRRPAALGAATALAIGLAGGLTTAAEAHHARVPGPVNAANTYGWGKHAWQDDFVGPRKPIWAVSAPGAGNVRTQHGMLTLNTGRAGSVSATLKGAGHAVGRWEIRLRSRQYSSAATSYRVRTELVPAAGRPQDCGARDVALESYRLGTNRADFFIRNLPDLAFTSHHGMNLGNDRWHTFAVEVTKSHIAWFVDAHVVSTERRAAALSGVPLTVRFAMVGEAGRRMNISRMQMDWLRYHTLRKPNNRSIDAPAPAAGTYAGAC
jgi:hypothetical protein